MAQSERRQLADLLDTVGPDAPTLCAGWTARDLTAHLLVRENRPDAALGILGGPLASYTESVQDKEAKKPFPESVDRVRNGPSGLSVFRFPGLDGAANLMEFLIHHEDVRRAEDGWKPRELTPEQQDIVWNRIGKMAKIMARKAPVGVVLKRPDTGATIIARKGTPIVQLTGMPVELALRMYGRTAVEIDYEGTTEAIDAFKSSPFGV